MERCSANKQMFLLDLSERTLIRLDNGSDGDLIAYPENGESGKFSLVGVTVLDYSVNQLKDLPPLPKSLEVLDCSHNNLTVLPPLPRKVKGLYCSDNQLTSLPALPTELDELYCFDNQLTVLPLLPAGLKDLNCYNNNLTDLPAELPKGLKTLYCTKNQLTVLPDLPEGLEELDCSLNPLKYIPFLRKIPRYLLVPKSLVKTYSVDNYQEGYRLQETNRYLFLTFFTEIGIQLDFLV